MLLMDSVINTAEMARRAGVARDSIMPMYTELADKLNPKKGPIPPRFVFDHKSTRTATELTLGRPKVFREILRHLRLPYPAMWVEWEDVARAELRTKMSDQYELLKEFKPYPRHLGFLIEAEPPSYRRGKITWAWTSGDDGMLGRLSGGLDLANIASVTVDFDLDGFASATTDGEPIMQHFATHPLTLARLWADNPLQQKELFSIWETCNHCLHPIAARERMSKFQRDLFFSDVVGEYIQVWAFLFLLTAKREAVDYREVDTSRINKARNKSGKAPLLSHRVVHLHLRPPSEAEIKRGPLDFRRKSPHIHLVSSYIGHRGDDWWLVLPYMRGSGPPVPKTVYVHG